MEQKKAGVQFRVWSVFLYVFAAFYYLSGVIVLIVWAMVMNNNEVDFALDVMEYLGGADYKTYINLYFGLSALLVFLIGTCDLWTGLLLRKPVRKGKGRYIFLGVFYCLAALLKFVGLGVSVFGVSVLGSGFSASMVIAFFSCLCTVLTAVFLFMRAAVKEDGYAVMGGVGSGMGENGYGAGPGGMNGGMGFGGNAGGMNGGMGFGGNAGGMNGGMDFGGMNAGGMAGMDFGGNAGGMNAEPQNLRQDSDFVTNAVEPWNNIPGGDTVTMTEAINSSPVKKPSPQKASKPAKKPMGRVQCIAGVISGQGYRLPEENKIVVGKDPQRCSMVVNDQYVSGVHCSIHYNAVKNVYRVQDYSSNGTFVNNMRIQKGAPMEYPPGTILSLADGVNQIKLG